MDVKRGGIYKLSENVQCFDQPILNHRPIVVIEYENKEQYIYAVFLGVKFADTKKIIV